MLALGGSVLSLLLGAGWWLDHQRAEADRAGLLEELARAKATAHALGASSLPAMNDGVPSPEPVPGSRTPHITEPPADEQGVDQVSRPASVTQADATPIATLSEQQVNAIEQFDVAMDREFERLEAREKAATDPDEAAMIQRIKEKLIALDELYRRADTVTDPAERMQIQVAMQQEMGAIIGLTRRDRNERLGKLATDIGYNDPQAIERVIQEIDRIYYETHMDWTKLFNRAPPAGP